MNTKAKTTVFLAAVLALGLGACASDPYRYVPADHRSTTFKEAIYSIPADNPSGTVRVQFVGLEDLKPKGPKGNDEAKVSVIHLKIIASNHSKVGNWQVNPQEAFLAFSNGATARPLETLPENLVVQPGQLSGMDFYFQLPPGLKGSKDIPEFDFHWHVTAVDQNVAQTTPFDRIEIPNQYASYNSYWDGPYYPGYTASMGFGWNHW